LPKKKQKPGRSNYRRGAKKRRTGAYGYTNGGDRKLTGGKGSASPSRKFEGKCELRNQKCVVPRNRGDEKAVSAKKLSVKGEPWGRQAARRTEKKGGGLNK